MDFIDVAVVKILKHKLLILIQVILYRVVATIQKRFPKFA